jgi:8-amino-7-oxononanoate synthase
MIRKRWEYSGIALQACPTEQAAAAAKGFCAPIAMLAGSSEVVERFERHSATRMHCSPPSAAAVAAAHRALEINRRRGDELRTRLAGLVSRLRQGLGELGMIGTPDLFPIQSLGLPGDVDAAALHDAMGKRGLRAVLHANSVGGNANPRNSLVVTARHSLRDIDDAVECIAGAAASVASASPNPTQRSRQNESEIKLSTRALYGLRSAGWRV